MKISISIATLLAVAAAAPAPQIVTVYQVSTQVINPDGSLYTNVAAAPVAAAPASPALVAPSYSAAAAAPAAAPSATQASTSFTSSTANLIISFIQKLFGSSSDPEPPSTTSASTAVVVAPVASPSTTGLAANYLVSTASTTLSTVAAQSVVSVVSASPTSLKPSFPPTLSSSSPSSSPTSSSSPLDSWAQNILAEHNSKRALHSAPALTWDTDAYNYAQNYANQYDCSGTLTHSHGPYGENLAAGYSTGADAVDAWYNEGSTFDYSAANTYNHFTQVVWKSTTKVGCAYKDCRAQNWGYYIICSYDPAGNVIGEEAANVLAN